MAREDAQLKLRLSEELKALVTEAAKANGRSVNAEIVHRLEQTFGGEEKLWSAIGEFEDTVPEMKEKLEELEAKVDKMWRNFGGGPFGQGD